MNSFLAVIIPLETEEPQQWVEQKLQPFDLNHKVERYKDYLSPQEEKYLMEYHDYDTRLEFLLKKNEKKEVYFQDEKGIYQFSERNLHWKWSNWGVGGINFSDIESPLKHSSEQWISYSLKVNDLQNFGFSAMLCPQGDWKDCHEFGWSEINESFNPRKNLQAWGDWRDFAENELKKLNDHILLSVVYQC